MTLAQLRKDINEDLERSGSYRSFYRHQRINFWLQQMIVISMPLWCTVMAMDVFEISLLESEVLYLVANAVFVFLSYKTDRSPQSPQEVKKDFCDKILAKVCLWMLEQEGDKLYSPIEKNVVAEGGNKE